jgi:hypothetical protein
MHFHGEPRLIMEDKVWAEWLRWYACGQTVPGHLTTPSAHRQALEIANELQQSAMCMGNSMSGEIAMVGFAFEVARNVALGKPILSFGFIAERLTRRADDGDDCWAFDLPPRKDPKVFQDASALAHEAVRAMKSWSYGMPLNERHLLSTIEIEGLRI